MISKVYIGNVSKGIDKINIGKKNNQNFVNISLGQLVQKIKYKLEYLGISVEVVDESYTSKASFLDNDFIPKTYKKDKSKTYVFSGKRKNRGLYIAKSKIKINADVNGAFNILRKSNPNFSVHSLKNEVEGLLHPYSRILI